MRLMRSINSGFSAALGSRGTFAHATAVGEPGCSYAYGMTFSLMGTSKNPDFIPTDGTTSHSTRSPKNGNQVAGYAVLQKKFLACIYTICGAAKFFPRLAFGRTLNF